MIVGVYLSKQVPIQKKKWNLIIIIIKYLNLTLLIGVADDASVFVIVLKT